jgi:PAS domain S-box-containing protein
MREAWSFETTIIPLPAVNGTRARIVIVAHETTALRRAIQRLRQSESRFRQLVETCAAPIVVHQNNSIIFLNNAAAQAIGAESKNMLIGADIRDYIILPNGGRPEDDRGLPPSLVVSENGRLQRINGEQLDIIACSVPLDYKGLPCIRLTFYDAAGQRQSAAEP